MKIAWLEAHILSLRLRNMAQYLLDRGVFFQQIEKFSFSSCSSNSSMNNQKPSFGSASSNLLQFHSKEYSAGKESVFRKSFNINPSMLEQEIFTFFIQNTL